MPRIVKNQRLDAHISPATAAHADLLTSMSSAKDDCTLVQCNPLTCDIQKLPPKCGSMTCGQGCKDQISCGSVSNCAAVTTAPPKK